MAGHERIGHSDEASRFLHSCICGCAGATVAPVSFRIVRHHAQPLKADGRIHGEIRPPSGLFLAETIVPAAAAAAQAIAAQELKLDSAEQRGAAAERRLAVAAAAWGVRKVRGPAAGFFGGGGCAL